MYSRVLLRDLLWHMEWADARVWAAVPAVRDDRLHQLLVHVHTVQRAFLTIWTRGDVNAVFTAAQQLSNPADAASWARSYYPEAHAFLDSVTADHFNDLIQMPWAAEITGVLGRPPHPTTLAETVFQVTSHSTYHRGQVNVRLRELGVEPPLVDYIAWLWSGRPAAEWRA
jgi:uncharacterized damage-inducible protein DinB